MSALAKLKHFFIRKKPRGIPPHVAESFDMAMHLMRCGDHASAITLLRGCTHEAPQLPEPFFFLGESFRASGDTNAAVTAYRHYLHLEPRDALGAGIKLFLLGETPQPDTLPPAYVTTLFDQYAENYDNVMTKSLGYTAYNALAGAVQAHHPKPFARILDLGCGTGLAGEAFKNPATLIDGVDISAGMLRKAHEKGIYATLHQTEIGTFLANAPCIYDLVIAADTFIYLGQLDSILAGISRVLVPGALLAFTVQAGTQGSVVLGHDHRYWHARAYIDTCLNAAGLKMLAATDIILRYEYGEPVTGTVYLIKN